VLFHFLNFCFRHFVKNIKKSAIVNTGLLFFSINVFLHLHASKCCIIIRNTYFEFLLPAQCFSTCRNRYACGEALVWHIRCARLLRERSVSVRPRTCSLHEAGTVLLRRQRVATLLSSNLELHNYSPPVGSRTSSEGADGQRKLERRANGSSLTTSWSW
jgi:hypothetical protein